MGFIGPLESQNQKSNSGKSMISEQIDTAISVIKYDFRQRQKRINEIKRKLAPSSEELKLMGSEITLIENVTTLIKEVKEKAFETLGKLPPQDEELEQSIVGAMMLEKSA